MLTLTETASTVVKAVVAQSPEAEPETGGLRIDSQSESSDLAVTIAAAPEPKDAVIEQEGARVFLGEGAAIALDDKVLDAQVGEDGSVRFEIANQQ